MSLDETKLHELLSKMVGDMGAAAVAPLVILGDKLGLYKALATKGPLTTEELADQTGTTERYVREWCAAQAGSGYSMPMITCENPGYKTYASKSRLRRVSPVGTTTW